MQKLFRSLIAVGGLAGLVACGDDVSISGPGLAISGAPVTAVQVGATVQLSANQPVTWSTSAASVASVDANGLVTAVGAGTASITATSTANTNDKASVTITVIAPAVRNVSVSPQNAIMKPGDSQAFVANVDADPGVARTVTWTSSSNTVATVDAAGVVTAVAPGAATITATSTANPTVSGAAAITVRQPIPATVSVSNITVTGTAGQTANLNNISGSIDVNLNVDPGEQDVNSVDVLIDGVVACSQDLSGAQSEALRIAAAFENVEEVIVSCQINTADFDPTTGVVDFFNGPHTLSARANIAGGTQVATPSTQLTFNNQSGFVALVSNTNTVGGPASAVNPLTGLKWIQGNVTLKLAAVNYTAGGATVTSINAAFLGKTFTDTPDAGTQIFTIDFPNSGTSALNIVNYQTTADADKIPLVTSSTLSSGNQGPTQLLNLGAKADTLGLTRLDSTRVDNVAPAAPTVGALTPWVNAAFVFDTTSVGLSNVSDAGVNAVTAEFWFINGALPGNATSCDVTGMTMVTAGTALTETLTLEYRAKVILRDALGNRRCVQLGGGSQFGADFGAPTNVTVGGVSSQQGFTSTATASGTLYTINTDGDTLSGIPLVDPALIRIVRTGVTSATNACVVGTGTFASCVAVAAPISASITGTSTVEGYYTLSAQLTDVAGNAGPTPPISLTYVVDATDPTFSGGFVLSSTYAGNAPAVIGGISVTDNLDLASLFGQVAYTAAGVNLEYPSLSIGTFGTPLEKTFTGSYTIPSLIRCIAPAGGPYTASNANKAQDITMFALDQAGNDGTQSPVAGDFVSRVADCGVVGTLSTGLVLAAFDQNPPDYGTGKTDVDLDGANVATTSSTSVMLSAVAQVSQNGGNPFSRVEFYYLNPATGGYVLIGQAPGSAGANTAPNRPWNYSLNWDPGAGVPTGAVTVIAIGVDADGDAAATGTQSVTIVP